MQCIHVCMCELAKLSGQLDCQPDTLKVVSPIPDGIVVFELEKNYSHCSKDKALTTEVTQQAVTSMGLMTYHGDQ